MTAQTQGKHHKVHSKSHMRADVSGSASSGEMKLFLIAVQMKKAGLSDSFIVNAVRAALEFEGISDLMHLWAAEKDKKEQDEIVADIQDAINDCLQQEVIEEMYIRFNDLEAIAKDIRAFKDSLYQEVMRRGGVSKLAELTGIPQPSLSRFFSSSAMPRRSTVLAIAKALDLNELKIDMKWSK